MEIMLTEEQYNEYLNNEIKSKQLEVVKDYINHVYNEDLKSSLVTQLSLLQDDLYLIIEDLKDRIENEKN